MASLLKILSLKRSICQLEMGVTINFDLNDAYRAIYRQTSDGKTEILEVIEVNKHKY